MKIYLSVHTNEKDGKNHKTLVKMLKKMNTKPYWYKTPPYDNALVDEADIVIVLPHLKDDWFIIGNGILSEMNRSSNADKPTFWYNRVSKQIQQITEIKLYPKENGDHKDWLNVGYIVNAMKFVDLQDEIDLIEQERLDIDLNTIINTQT